MSAAASSLLTPPLGASAALSLPMPVEADAPESAAPESAAPETASAAPGSASTETVSTSAVRSPSAGLTAPSAGFLAALDAGIRASIGRSLDPATGVNGAAAARIEGADASIEEARSLLASAFDLPSDPMLMLMQLGAALARQTSQADRAAVEQGRDQQAVAAAQRHDALVAADRAARRAERWLSHAPPWVGKLVKGITLAAGLAAASFTGGASLGLAIAGAVLIAGAQGFGKLATALGASPTVAGFVQLACSVAGAALMMGSGFAGGGLAAAPSSIAADARQVINLVTDVVKAVEAAFDLRTGIGEVGGAIFTARSASSEVDAAAAGTDEQRAGESTRTVLESMSRSLATFAHAREQLLATSDVERRRAMETAEGLGR